VVAAAGPAAAHRREMACPLSRATGAAMAQHVKSRQPSVHPGLKTDAAYGFRFFSERCWTDGSPASEEFYGRDLRTNVRGRGIGDGCADLRPAWTSYQAIAGNKHTEWRRIVGRLREAAVRAQLLYARTAATKKAGEKTSQAVGLLTEIALMPVQGSAGHHALRDGWQDAASNLSVPADRPDKTRSLGRHGAADCRDVDWSECGTRTSRALRTVRRAWLPGFRFDVCDAKPAHVHGQKIKFSDLSSPKRVRRSSSAGRIPASCTDANRGFGDSRAQTTTGAGNTSREVVIVIVVHRGVGDATDHCGTTQPNQETRLVIVGIFPELTR